MEIWHVVYHISSLYELGIFCPWNELSSPFFASANLNCCGTRALSLLGLPLNGRVAGAAGVAGADCLADHSVCEIRVAGGDKLP